MELNEFIFRALGVPFKDFGRDYDGWDCWGMLRCAYRDVLGIELPSFATDYPDAGRSQESCARIRALMEANHAAWSRVEEPRPTDALLLRVRGYPVHVGLVVAPGKFLHTEARVGTIIERTGSMQWKDRLEGYYRWTR